MVQAIRDMELKGQTAGIATSVDEVQLEFNTS